MDASTDASRPRPGSALASGERPEFTDPIHRGPDIRTTSGTDKRAYTECTGTGKLNRRWSRTTAGVVDEMEGGADRAACRGSSRQGVASSAREAGKQQHRCGGGWHTAPRHPSWRQHHGAAARPAPHERCRRRQRTQPRAAALCRRRRALRAQPRTGGRRRVRAAKDRPTLGAPRRSSPHDSVPAAAESPGQDPPVKVLSHVHR